MQADEREICAYLRGWPGQFVALKEICRRAGGKRRFRNDPFWAVPVLRRLVEQGLVETDSTAHYRLRKAIDKKKPRKWLAPEVRKTLERSGKDFHGVLEIENEEEAAPPPGGPSSNDHR